MSKLSHLVQSVNSRKTYSDIQTLSNSTIPLYPLSPNILYQPSVDIVIVHWVARPTKHLKNHSSFIYPTEGRLLLKDLDPADVPRVRFMFL